MRKLRSLIVSLALVVVALMSASSVWAADVDPAFTYQGRIDLNGERLTATADMQFRLYSLAIGGVQIGSTQTVSNIALVDGLFTVDLDFGDNAFDSDERWLQISVRSPSGGGLYTTLSPRQRISAAPYALYSLAPWEPVTAGIIYTAGRVGIGTVSPGFPLHVQSTSSIITVYGNNQSSIEGSES